MIEMHLRSSILYLSIYSIHILIRCRVKNKTRIATYGYRFKRNRQFAKNNQLFKKTFFDRNVTRFKKTFLYTVLYTSIC